MRRLSYRIWTLLLGLGGLSLLSGCDEAGVTDIVFGALQLAFGIVDVAT
jgi:hypothetical protein